MSDELDVVDDIFERAVRSKGLFKDRNVLRPDYVPSRLLFRDEQIITMAQIMSPLLKGSRPSNLLLYGKTGTGKTAVAKFVLKRLEEKASSRGMRVKFVYSNTKMARTVYRVLWEVGRSLGLQLPFTGLSIGELFDRILAFISRSSLSVVLVLDELDFLVKNFGDDLLYELTRCNERLKGGSVTLIGISNDLKFKEMLDPRVLSSLSEEELVFPPYTVEELKAILLDRVKLAYREGVVEEATVNLCAALAGSEHGDARRAVDLLRVSGELAEREGAEKVTERHVRLAIQKIEHDRMIDALSSLPTHEKLVLASVLKVGQADSTGEVYSEYVDLCRRVGMEPLTRRRVSGLISELDMLGLVSANVRSKGRYGRTKKIALTVSGDLIRSVFREDPIVGVLFR